MIYEKVNLNPSGRKRSDCVIRAIMKAEGETWTDVYKGLSDVGLEIFGVQNEKEVYGLYLERQGWKKNKMPRFDDKTRYTVQKFADANPRGTFIISIARHLTVVIDGTLYDTWNCARKSVGNYWSK
jgi:hypothetical protein